MFVSNGMLSQTFGFFFFFYFLDAIWIHYSRKSNVVKQYLSFSTYGSLMSVTRNEDMIHILHSFRF